MPARLQKITFSMVQIKKSKASAMEKSTFACAGCEGNLI